MTHHDENHHTNGPVIRTVGLTRHYTRNKQTIEAVRGLDLEIAPGELVAFLGPNGAGKSTTLRMLTTLIAADLGHRRGRRLRRQPRPGRGPALDRVRRAGQRRRPPVPRPRRAGQPGPRARPVPPRRAGPDRRAARGLRPHRARRPAGVPALGRAAAPAGRRDRAGAGAGDPLPRRAVDRARPAEPGEPPGAGTAAQRRARHHDRAHDPLPRGGRRARGPRDRHRPRPDDRRRHRGRAEVRARRPGVPGVPHRRRRDGRRCRSRPDPRRAGHGHRHQACQVRAPFGRDAAPGWSPTSRPPGRRSPGWRSSGRRSTTSSSTSPAAACASPTRPRLSTEEGEAA